MNKIYPDEICELAKLAKYWEDKAYTLEVKLEACRIRRVTTTTKEEFQVSQKWYQGADGWEEGYEYIDLGYDGSFTAGRRKVMEGRVLYEGSFWCAATGERSAAYLEVLFEGDNMDHWIHAEVLPRHYEIYEDIEDGILYLFIFDHQGYLEFYSTYTNSADIPADMHQDLQEFNRTGIIPDWEDGLIDSEIWKQLRKCRMNSRFQLVFDSTGTYVKKHYK